MSDWQKDDANLPRWAMRMIKWLAWSVGSSVLVILLLLTLAAGAGIMVGLVTR